jgi:hypothetical protein
MAKNENPARQAGFLLCTCVWSMADGGKEQVHPVIVDVF